VTTFAVPAGREALTGMAGTVDHRPVDDAELTEAEAACRDAVRGVVGGGAGGGDASACDAEALEPRLASPDEWSDVRLQPGLTDVVMLHTGGLPQSVRDEEVDHRRAAVDEAMTRALDRLGLCPPGTRWALSGHLWYRAGSVMGWHTNTRVPGWRAYLSWVGEPDRSFFRWREPGSGSVATSWDRGLDLRLFHLPATEAVWHCVWAGTERHSFGYRLVASDPA
jgi:hypothetical protein